MTKRFGLDILSDININNADGSEDDSSDDYDYSDDSSDE